MKQKKKQADRYLSRLSMAEARYQKRIRVKITNSLDELAVV